VDRVHDDPVSGGADRAPLELAVVPSDLLPCALDVGAGHVDRSLHRARLRLHLLVGEAGGLELGARDESLSLERRESLVVEASLLLVGALCRQLVLHPAQIGDGHGDFGFRVGLGELVLRGLEPHQRVAFGDHASLGREPHDPLVRIGAHGRLVLGAELAGLRDGDLDVAALDLGDGDTGERIPCPEEVDPCQCEASEKRPERDGEDSPEGAGRRPSDALRHRLAKRGGPFPRRHQSGPAMLASRRASPLL
jgi:hypothetical protein